MTKKKQYPDVQAGQVWSDRDSRMRRRRVRVIAIIREGKRVRVSYRHDNEWADLARTFYSDYARFQRAFELVS